MNIYELLKSIPTEKLEMAQIMEALVLPAPTAEEIEVMSPEERHQAYLDSLGDSPMDYPE